jgi:hypothetical protein
VKTNLFVLGLLLLLSGCGQGLSGTYVQRAQGGIFDKLTFNSDGKVDLTMMGNTVVASYTVSGSRVEISANGQTQLLTIDAQGCLDGGLVMGKFCKA